MCETLEINCNIILSHFVFERIILLNDNLKQDLGFFRVRVN